MVLLRCDLTHCFSQNKTKLLTKTRQAFEQWVQLDPVCPGSSRTPVVLCGTRDKTLFESSLLFFFNLYLCWCAGEATEQVGIWVTLPLITLVNLRAKSNWYTTRLSQVKWGRRQEIFFFCQDNACENNTTRCTLKLTDMTCDNEWPL